MIKKIALFCACCIISSCQPSYIKVAFVKPDIKNNELPIYQFHGKKINYNGIDGYFYDMSNVKIIATNIANYQTMKDQCSFNQNMWIKSISDYNKVNK